MSGNLARGVRRLMPAAACPALSADAATIASLATLAGSLAMRIDVMRQGDATADDPAVSMRFAQPR